jgi:hypothetical protein
VFPGWKGHGSLRRLVPITFVQWSDFPDTTRGIVGQRVHALHARALNHAVEELLAVDGSRTMKIASGEHLAGIWLTALVGPPATIDQQGGIDLTFRKSTQRRGGWMFGEHSWAAFELKSLPGPFRQIERHQKLGDSFSVRFRSAADILLDATDKLTEAIEQLERKVSDPACCKCVFLLIHPFDGLAVEAFSEDPIIGHRLPSPSDSADLDMLWVYWHPGLLAWWSRETHRWTDAILSADPYTAQNVGDEEDPVFRAEGQFLAEVPDSKPSPWWFRVSAVTEAPDKWPPETKGYSG